MPHQDRLNIAVFIDFDNIEIGVRTTLSEHFDVGTILEALKERGEVVTKIAYADWTRAGEYSRALTQHAIRLVQRNLTPGGDKNGADINLALDALEMAFTHPHINAYVIVGGDSDFLSLVEKLKQYDKKVFVVGGRAFTSVILQRNCHEFIAYENLVRKPAARGGRPEVRADRHGADRPGVPDRAPRAQDSRRPRGHAADRVAEEHAAPARLDLLRAELRRIVVSRFRREARAGRPRAAEARGPQRHGGAQPGLCRRRGRDRASGAEAGDDGAPATRRRRRRDPLPNRRPERGRGSSDLPAQPPVTQAGTTPKASSSPGSCSPPPRTARWPMYLRNVKQILRAGAFDERRYGFGGLMDLLRAASARPDPARARSPRRPARVPGFRAHARIRRRASCWNRGKGSRSRSATTIAMIAEISPSRSRRMTWKRPVAATAETDAAEILDGESAGIIDTTAELLGRATSRRPRTRSATQRKGPVKKAASPRRTSRAKKSTASAHDEKV